MSRIWRRGSFQWSWECGARKFANSCNGTRLRWITLPEGPEAEGLERSRADAVGAAVYAEEESVGPGGDQVAVAVGAETPVLVMLFDVTPNLLQVTDDLPAWAEKEIFGNHSRFATAVSSWHTSGRGGPSVLFLNLPARLPDSQPDDKHYDSHPEDLEEHQLHPSPPGARRSSLSSIFYSFSIRCQGLRSITWSSKPALADPAVAAMIRA